MKRARTALSALAMLACMGAASTVAWAQGAAAGSSPVERERERYAQPQPQPPSQPGSGAEGDRPRRARGGAFAGEGRGGPDQPPTPGRPGADNPPGGPEGNRDPLMAEPGSRMLRMLDLRELSGLIPPEHGQQPPALWRRWGGQEGGRSPFTEAPTPPEGGESGRPPVVALVRSLAEALSLSVQPVGEGVILVGGAEENQVRLGQMLGQVRNLYAERINLDLSVISVPAGSAPEVGTPVSGGKVLVHSHQTLVRHAPTPVAVTEEITYIEGWQPIVADNAVGYQPGLGSLTKGLTCEVTIGADEQGNGATSGGMPIAIRGAISDASITDKVIELSAASGKTSLPIGLPRRQHRTINASARVASEATVIAVVPGFDGDQVLVIAAAAREVETSGGS
ncbi:MAG: hypothetical protein IT435_04630 [Phycisphaerales bacterium]|nr:hypothetical protein [Phycisphaerales bacterium]